MARIFFSSPQAVLSSLTLGWGGQMGKIVAKCYKCERAGLWLAQKDGLCLPCQEGEKVEGGWGGGGGQWGQH